VSERGEVERRWRVGEERLYPVATVRPDLYEAVIGLVRSLVDHLQSVPDTDALVVTYRTAVRDAELADAGIAEADIPPEVDRDLVRDAAYQVRARELRQRAAVEQAETAIRRARAAGEATVTIWSEGDQELWPPYRRVEMSLASGRAVAVSTTMDPETMTPRFALEGLELDPETGAAAEAEPIAPRREFSDPDEWRAAAQELRRALLTT
jgi:regulator of protease activity HflC (stomatin/prohibitin superfamily)